MFENGCFKLFTGTSSVKQTNSPDMSHTDMSPKIISVLYYGQDGEGQKEALRRHFMKTLKEHLSRNVSPGIRPPEGTS